MSGPRQEAQGLFGDAIRAELRRQHDDSRFDVYFVDLDDGTGSVQGIVDLNALADAISKVVFR